MVSTPQSPLNPLPDRFTGDGEVLGEGSLFTPPLSYQLTSVASLALNENGEQPSIRGAAVSVGDGLSDCAARTISDASFGSAQSDDLAPLSRQDNVDGLRPSRLSSRQTAQPSTSSRLTVNATEIIERARRACAALKAGGDNTSENDNNGPASETSLTTGGGGCLRLEGGFMATPSSSTSRGAYGDRLGGGILASASRLLSARRIRATSRRGDSDDEEEGDEEDWVGGSSGSGDGADEVGGMSSEDEAVAVGRSSGLRCAAMANTGPPGCGVGRQASAGAAAPTVARTLWDDQAGAKDGGSSSDSEAEAALMIKYGIK